jgi:hypothetical protein
LDLYHGEEIRVTEKEAVISVNIPLDIMSDDPQKAAARVVWKERLRRVEHGLSIASIILALYLVVATPSAWTIGLFLVQVGLWVLFYVLSRARKPRSWGVVYDKRSRKPLASTIVRVFEPAYNKLVETKVTDRAGRYFILLGPSEYFATFEKVGYEKAEVRPIDYSRSREAEEFSARVDLAPITTEPFAPNPQVQPPVPKVPSRNSPL